MSGDDTISVAAGAPAATVAAPEKDTSGFQALYFYGITRAKTFRAASGEDAEGVLRIRYRDIEALTRHTAYETPVLEEAAVLTHQRVLETAMRRGTVLPAPFGIVFRGRRQLLRVLQDQYTVLEEGLSFLDGHWELRIHISSAARGTVDVELSDLAMQLYSDLRQGVRAAVPFAREEERLVSAAFLVERGAWLDFMKRAEDLGSHHPELSFDITGPWPAYDFVRIRD
jgi:hypothetical protein